MANELDAYELTIVLTISSTGHSDNRLHVNVDPSKLNGLSKPGFVKCEQILTVAMSRLDGIIGQLEPKYMEVIGENLLDVLGLS